MFDWVVSVIGSWGYPGVFALMLLENIFPPIPSEVIMPLAGYLVAEGRLNTKSRAVASRSKTGRGLTTVPIFLLVPQVKLPKRLDLARDAERAIDAVPGRIVAGWVEGRQ